MGRRNKQVPDRDAKRTRLLRNILSAIWTLHDVNGSSASQIASFLRQQPRARLPRRHVLVQIRRALRRAQEAGLVVEQRGCYRLMIREGITPFPVRPDPEIGNGSKVQRVSKKKSRCGKRCPSCHRRLRVLRVAQNKRLSLKKRRETPVVARRPAARRKVSTRKTSKTANTITNLVLGRKRQPSPASTWREYKTESSPFKVKSTLTTTFWPPTLMTSSSSKESLVSKGTSADAKSTLLDLDSTEAITSALSSLSLKSPKGEGVRTSSKCDIGENSCSKRVSAKSCVKIRKQSKQVFQLTEKCENNQYSCVSTFAAPENCLNAANPRPIIKRVQGLTLIPLKRTEKQADKKKNVFERPEVSRKKNRKRRKRSKLSNKPQREAKMGTDDPQGSQEVPCELIYLTCADTCDSGVSRISPKRLASCEALT